MRSGAEKVHRTAARATALATTAEPYQPVGKPALAHLHKARIEDEVRKGLGEGLSAAIGKVLKEHKKSQRLKTASAELDGWNRARASFLMFGNGRACPQGLRFHPFDTPSGNGGYR
jgi:hypothetical protein